MKTINSKIETWGLSSLGAIVVTLSIALLLSTVSKANEPAAICTADCGGGRFVSCTIEYSCTAEDSIGCTWRDDFGFHSRSCQ